VLSRAPVPMPLRGVAELCQLPRGQFDHAGGYQMDTLVRSLLIFQDRSKLLLQHRTSHRRRHDQCRFRRHTPNTGLDRQIETSRSHTSAQYQYMSTTASLLCSGISRPGSGLSQRTSPARRHIEQLHLSARDSRHTIEVYDHQIRRN